MPWGFRKLLNYIYDRYHMPIYCTEVRCVLTRLILSQSADPLASFRTQKGYSIWKENDRSVEEAVSEYPLRSLSFRAMRLTPSHSFFSKTTPSGSNTSRDSSRDCETPWCLIKCQFTPTSLGLLATTLSGPPILSLSLLSRGLMF